ncbi:hypothetical protein G3I40_05410 [Streptomyces sp. SID14478]|uniref:hypothetical protein n=1 Tax=Streptomyces sp. SID14478 TaxID=2706073 RepID=UPI0013DACD3E|nr:hypothetical protein [Streptomyces sp. SID14478]NEB74670.1 hypothetical protein [Streptomyces sp. SID14478]
MTAAREAIQPAAARRLRPDRADSSGFDAMNPPPLLARRQRLDKEHVTLHLTARSVRTAQLLTTTETVDHVIGQAATIPHGHESAGAGRAPAPCGGAPPARQMTDHDSSTRFEGADA